MFVDHFKKFRTFSTSISENIEKYFLKKVSNNVLVNFGNFFKNFKKKSKNFVVYCGDYRELFQFFFKFWNISRANDKKISITTEDV